MTKMAKIDTLYVTKTAENHTLWERRYPYNTHPGLTFPFVPAHVYFELVSTIRLYRGTKLARIGEHSEFMLIRVLFTAGFGRLGAIQ